jgi:integrase
VLDLKAARELGSKALRAVAEGRDPGREKTRRRASPAAKDNSIEHLVEQFIARHCARHYRIGSARETERILRRHVLPAWRGFTTSEITRADVRALVEPMESTPVQANHVYRKVRRLFSWAVEQELVAASPVAGMKVPFPETARDRVLSDFELLLVWQAAEMLGGPGGLLIKLLMLTGQRRSEVAGMTWDELDLEQGTWTLPGPRVKNGKTHIVPLAAAVVELLAAAPRLGAYAASLTGKRPITEFAAIKNAIDALLPPDTPRWVIHDLRRSFASGLARLGVGLPVIERALNHVSGSFRGVVGIYQRHDYQHEIRAATETWASHILALGRPQASVVRSLRRPRTA